MIGLKKAYPVAAPAMAATMGIDLTTVLLMVLAMVKVEKVMENKVCENVVYHSRDCMAH